MKCSIKNALKLFQKVTYNIENVASNEANLEAKIEKKKVELERNQKRLQTLKKVRPAFMDEYEKMEEELRKLYEEYIVKFRCMTHLEQQIEEYERVEQEKMKERTIATRKIMERLRQDESMHQFDGKSLTTLFRKKRFMLDEKLQRNASKFATFLRKENPKLLFPFFIS